MRLVEFLIFMLEAYAQTLQRLAALLGEDALIELMESMDEFEVKSSLSANPEWLQPPRPGSSSDFVYGELEGAVGEMSLSAVLQFYLWAFPPYRAIIETSLDLNSRLQGPGGEAGVALVDEVISQAEEWIRRIPIAIGHVAQVDRATHVPWLRFRAEVLKRVGRRPMGPVY